MRKIAIWLFFISILIISLSAFNYATSMLRSDWVLAFRPATIRWTNQESPYRNNYRPFANAPWILPVLAPLALLSPGWGKTILFAVNLICYTYTIRKLGSGRLATIAFLLSPAILWSLMTGQIEGILSLGFIAPAPVGLIILAIKPQMATGITVYWLVQAWKEGKAIQVLSTFIPVAGLIAIANLLYPDWIPAMRNIQVVDWNSSFWPNSLPIAIILLVVAIRKQNKGIAISSSIFASPYLAYQTLGLGLFSLVDDKWLMVGASVTMWIAYIIRIMK